MYGAIEHGRDYSRVEHAIERVQAAIYLAHGRGNATVAAAALAALHRLREQEARAGPAGDWEAFVVLADHQ